MVKKSGGQSAQRPHARMKEVAERANVSAMTVSRALRSPEKVSPATLQRIRKAVRDVGYVPNEIAGGLKAANRTRLVAAIVPSIRNSLFAATIQGLTDALRLHGVSLVLGDSHYSQSEEEELIAAFLGYRPSGMVLHNSTHTAAARRMLRGAGIPVVEVGDLAERRVDLAVSYSNFAAGKAMTEHLIARGYRTIGLVSIPLAGNERAEERRRGYLAALREAGRQVDAALMLETPGSFENGGRALVEVVSRRPDIDAVFLAGDVLSIGAMLECRRRSWAVPGRIAIAGFDDWEIARQLDTPITALEIPRYDIGRIAGELILRRLAGDADDTRAPIDVGFRVIPRGST